MPTLKLDELTTDSADAAGFPLREDTPNVFLSAVLMYSVMEPVRAGLWASSGLAGAAAGTAFGGLCSHITGRYGRVAFTYPGHRADMDIVAPWHVVEFANEPVPDPEVEEDIAEGRVLLFPDNDSFLTAIDGWIEDGETDGQ